MTCSGVHHVGPGCRQTAWHRIVASFQIIDGNPSCHSSWIRLSACAGWLALFVGMFSFGATCAAQTTSPQTLKGVANNANLQLSDLATALPAKLSAKPASPLSVLVLGTAQDAGFPQAGCLKGCCRDAWQDSTVRRYPTSIAIIDSVSKQRWLLDCTWQLPDQLHLMQQVCPRKDSPGIDGILLTHGHIGHYTGLMHLGREVMGAKGVPVYAMPKMRQFLTNNGPWNLLLKLDQVQLKPLAADQPVRLNERVSVTPIAVPHRGEFTETVGFIVKTPGKSVLYLPDIDKWSRWERKIETVLSQVDLAFIDATFFRNGEIPGRDMSEIPHPFVEESLLRFQSLDRVQRNKIHFIHLNHTNPALDPQSAAVRQIRRAGMNLAKQGELYPLMPPLK